MINFLGVKQLVNSGTKTSLNFMTQAFNHYARASLKVFFGILVCSTFVIGGTKYGSSSVPGIIRQDLGQAEPEASLFSPRAASPVYAKCHVHFV